MIKIKQRALATLLALTIPLNLVGCKDTNTKQNAGSQEQTTDTPLNPTSKDQITPKEVEITEFLKRMSEIAPLYNLEEFYFSQEELAELDEIANSMYTCDYKETDYSHLAETIIENSIPSMPKWLSTANKSEYVKLLEKNLQKAIDISFSTSSNVSEDICLLRTLKIIPVDLSGTGSSVLYDYETNTISLDYKLVFKEMEEQNERATSLNTLGADPLYSTYSKDEFITKVYGNIINMVRERICYCRKEKGETNTTISYNRALSHLLYVANEEQITHSQEFKEFTKEGKFPNKLFYNDDYEALRLLLAAFNENKTIDDLYKTIFDADLKALYDFFGLETKEDIETFYRIDESINLLNCISRSFDKLRDSANIETVGELEESVGYAYRIDIYRMATESLMKRLVEDGDYTVDEALFLQGIIKSYVIKNAYDVTFDSKKIDFIRIYDTAFLENIKEVDTIFKDFIKELYNLSNEEYSDAKNKQYQNYYTPILVEHKRSHNINGKKIAERFPLLQTIYTRSYVYHWDLETFEKDYEAGTSNSLERPYIIEPCE